MCVKYINAFLYAKFLGSKIADSVEDPAIVWYIGGFTLLIDALVISVVIGLIRMKFGL